MRTPWLLALMLLASLSHAQTLQKINNHGLKIDGYFYPANIETGHKAPAIVALHGCGGMLVRRGQPNARSAAYAKLLNQQGWHVLFVDSLTARGVSSICGEYNQVTQAQRVTDVQAAIAFLAKQKTVDPERLGVLGWSHGGLTALLSADSSITYTSPPRAAFAYYPSCDPSILKPDWQPAKPVLMQLGAADDWTNPIPCQQLAQKWTGKVEQNTYPHAHHGFDSNGLAVVAMHLTTPSGPRTVHTGGQPAAKAAAQAKLISFFEGHFK